MLIMNAKNRLHVQWFSTATTNFVMLLNFHDGKGPSQISLEVIWATKWWLHRALVALLLSGTAEDAVLVYKLFCKGG